MTCKLILLFAAVIIPSLAFFSLFGSYTAFDDEGYSIAVIRSVADGVPLYTQQFDFHGPLPFLAKALIFRAVRVPITQESMRFWVLGVWLVSCLCLSLAVLRLTRNQIWSACAVVITGAHLFALRFNPGHPEDFVVLFLSLAILIASVDVGWLSDNRKTAILGCIGGVLAATKINVGLFYFFGLALWILASLPRTNAWRAGAVLFTTVATALPAILMRSFVSQSWQLLVVSTLSIFITCVAFLRSPIPNRFGWTQLWVAVSSAAAIFFAVLVLAQICGSRFQDVLDQTVVVAATHTNMIVRSVFSPRAAVAIPIFLLACLSQWKRIWSGTVVRVELATVVLKIALPLLAMSLAALMRFQFYMPLIGAVCWLTAFPTGSEPIGERNQSGRVFIASIAVFQMLQVFPIRGAQTSWSTLALCVCGLLLISDGFSELPFYPAISKFAIGSVQLVTGVMFSLLAILTATLAGSYLHTPSIGFSGASLIRVPMETKSGLDWVTGDIEHYCDALVTQPGLDSFLLWSSQPGSEFMRHSPLLLVDWPITMPEDRQREATSRLIGATRVCAVYSKRLSDWWIKRLPASAQARLANLPLVSYIQQLTPIRRAGDYEIRGNAAVSRIWADDYLLEGIRNMHGSRDAIGVPLSLLQYGTPASLSLRFQVNGAGPLISVQGPITDDSDDPPLSTEPLLYVSGRGILMVHASGVYLSSRAAVADGQWHQLILRPKARRWAVSIDGQEQASLDDFTASARPPHYLQLGPAYIEKCPELGSGWREFLGKFEDIRVLHEESSYALNSAHAR